MATSAVDLEYASGGDEAAGIDAPWNAEPVRRPKVLVAVSRTEAESPASGPLEARELPPWFMPVVERVGRLLLLPANWDSYGARPVSSTNAAAALDLLVELADPRLPEPAIVPTSGGGLQIEWHTPRVDLEIEVFSPGRYRVGYEDFDQGEEWEEEVTSDLTLLSRAIRKLAS